jgi:hypothetical protein
MVRVGVALILILSLLALSFFSLPAFNEKGESYVQCKACHAAYEEERKFDVHKDRQCRECHIISEFSEDLYHHNASIIECTNCHERAMYPITCKLHWCKE